jgi:hypothetical protein
MGPLGEDRFEWPIHEGAIVRWVGWIVAVAALGTMVFARLTDDTDRVGRDPDWSPTLEAPGPPPAPVGEGTPDSGRVEGVSESL